MKLKDAIKVVCDEIIEDDGYYASWVSNIAMAFKDELSRSGIPIDKEVIHNIANKAASEFLNTLCRNSIKEKELKELKYKKLYEIMHTNHNDLNNPSITKLFQKAHKLIESGEQIYSHDVNESDVAFLGSLGLIKIVIYPHEMFDDRN